MPSKVTVPLTVAAVAGSIGVEVVAGFAPELGEVPCSSLVFSFLLQPTNNPSPSRQSKIIVAQIFLFIMSPFRQTNASVPNFDNENVRVWARVTRPAGATPVSTSHLRNTTFYRELPGLAAGPKLADCFFRFSGG